MGARHATRACGGGGGCGAGVVLLRGYRLSAYAGGGGAPSLSLSAPAVARCVRHIRRAASIRWHASQSANTRAALRFSALQRGSLCTTCSAPRVLLPMPTTTPTSRASPGHYPPCGVKASSMLLRIHGPSDVRQRFILDVQFGLHGSWCANAQGAAALRKLTTSCFQHLIQRIEDNSDEVVSILRHLHN
jgi:hypothetical protein